MTANRDVRQCLCLSLRRSARQVTQFYDDRLRASGLRTTQFQLLAAISETGPTAQQPLADLMGMDRTTLTRNLALLSRGGLVRVDQAKNDRRERMIELTSAGGRALDAALPLWQKAQEAMRQNLSANAGIPVFGELLRILGQVSAAGEK